MGADVTVGAADPTNENVVGASVSEVLSSVEIEVGDGVESGEEVNVVGTPEVGAAVGMLVSDGCIDSDGLMEGT